MTLLWNAHCGSNFHFSHSTHAYSMRGIREVNKTGKQIWTKASKNGFCFCSNSSTSYLLLYKEENGSSVLWFFREHCEWVIVCVYIGIILNHHDEIVFPLFGYLFIHLFVFKNEFAKKKKFHAWFKPNETICDNEKNPNLHTDINNIFFF